MILRNVAEWNSDMIDLLITQNLSSIEVGVSRKMSALLCFWLVSPFPISIYTISMCYIKDSPISISSGSPSMFYLCSTSDIKKICYLHSYSSLVIKQILYTTFCFDIAKREKNKTRKSSFLKNMVKIRVCNLVYIAIKYIQDFSSFCLYPCLAFCY